MEHQKRRRMQHRVELSTLLKLVIASGKETVSNTVKFENISKELANEAMASVYNNDLSVNSRNQLRA